MPNQRSRLLPNLLLAVLLAAACAGERVVWEGQSDYQQIIVSQRGDKVRSLRFERRGAVQSRVQLGHPEVLLLPYVRATMVGLAFTKEPRRILVVGLGGGSMPRFLHHQLPEAVIDVVELDPMIVQVAREWFEVAEDRRLKLLLADGREFLEQIEDAYDFIILDAYGKSSIPKALTTREFLLAARKALDPNGVLVANVWSGTANPLYASMATTYQAVFDELLVFPVPKRSNRIFVALPYTLDIEGSPSREQLESLDERLGGELGLADLLDKGDPRATHLGLEGEILVD